MMYHADIPNGNYTESITVEGENYGDAHYIVRKYLKEAFGPSEAPALLAKWEELAQPVKSQVVHYALSAEEAS